MVVVSSAVDTGSSFLIGRSVFRQELMSNTAISNKAVISSVSTDFFSGEANEKCLDWFFML
jgi:hypothetical protein